MMAEEPPFIGVGADVSAKFKGAFCEARVKSAKKHVKCKVLLKNGMSHVVNDDQIEGPLKLNGIVKVKQENDSQEATIIKLTDHSLYTVVFDDGDEKTLRRTSLCLKGERHFQEDETLDNRPLNNPEIFSAPVARQPREEKTRKRTRLHSQNSDNEEDDDDDDDKPTNKRKRESYFGKVLCVELGERRKSWFPALGLRKHMAERLTLGKGQLFVQSFKDGRRLAINKTDTKEFCKEKEPLLSYMKGDTKIDPILRSSIEKALMFFDNGELPRGWNIDLNDATESSSSEDDESEKEDTLSQEEEEFLNKLHKYMDEQGTPIMKPPVLGCKEINLYKLYGIVMKHGGMDEVTNNSKWRTIYIDMGMTNPPTTASYNIRNFYKRYIYPYEALVRGIDISSDKKGSEKDKEATKEKEVVKEKEKMKKPESDSENENNATRRLTRMQSKNESDSEVERRETRSSRPRRSSVEKHLNLHENKSCKQIGSPVESSDESLGSYLEMSSYSKRSEIEVDSDVTKHSEVDELVDIVNSPHSSVVSEDKEFSDTKSESELTITEDGRYPIGARILVKYGKGKLHRAYEAKIIDVDSELTPDLLYYVHYRGWNHRYDEWIKHDFIEGLSPYPPKKKGAASKGAKGNSSGGYKNHPEPPGIHNFHQTPQPTPRTTSRSRKAGSPPLTDPATPPSNPIEKTAKASQSTQKQTNTSVKPAQSAKINSTTPKQSITPQKAAQQKSIAANLKSTFGAQKIETPFVDMKPHPVKPRTTRNSMQDVFLITALEESISESPAGDISGSASKARRGREKQNQSIVREEEESESSSAKEDDVETLERGRSTPQRKATRRKRNERSPFGKQESKDSAEDEDFASEYSSSAWSEDRGEGRTSRAKATESKKKERSKAGKAKLGNTKQRPFEGNSHDRSGEYERQSSAIEILTDCALMKNEEKLSIRSEERHLEIKEEEMETDEIIGDQIKSGRFGKRKSDGKILKDKKSIKVEGESVKGVSKNSKEMSKIENFEPPKSEKIFSGKENNDEINDDIENKKIKLENNNIEDGGMANDDGLACMEHVVDILQRAAAIDAEKQRKIKENTSSPARGKQEAREMRSPSATLQTPERDRRKKKRERKRRRRMTSCSVADASESENSMQSPSRKGKDRNHSNGEFEKEKYDFVSDMDEVAQLDAAERIRVIQGRIYDIQKLYGKLKTELASIERRKRRKLRKQGENVNRNGDIVDGK